MTADSSQSKPDSAVLDPAVISGTGLHALRAMRGLPLRAVLTRPAERQTALATQLTTHGWQVLEMPALDLRALDHLPHPLPRPDEYDWVMFVSRFAWQIYHSQIRQAWPKKTGIATVGQATAAIIDETLSKQISCKPNILSPDIAGSQDSEGLWRQLSTRLNASSRVLIIAGRDGRTWLADRLREQGVATDVVDVYERRPAILTPQMQRQLQGWSEADAYGHSGVWLLTSKHSIQAMTSALVTAKLLKNLKPAAWLLTHPRLIEDVEQLDAKIGAGYQIPVVQCAPDLTAIQMAFEQIARVLRPARHLV